MREPKVCLIAIIAALLCGGWAAEARAEPIPIGVAVDGVFAGGPADETTAQPILFERATATTAVPEPATIALLAVALTGLARLCRIRRRS